MKSFKFFLILLILVFLSSFIYGIFLDRESISVLTYAYRKENLSTKIQPLFKGDIARGSIVSRENNLGIVAIKFIVPQKPSTDDVIFRIKEQGAKDWYYSAVYQAKEFGGYSLFPFGFPVVKDSKGKTFLFELESIQGRKEDAIRISSDEPAIIAKHKFAIRELIQDKNLLLIFGSEKIVPILINQSVFQFFIRSLFLVISVFALFMFAQKVKNLHFSFKLQISTLLKKKLKAPVKKIIYIIMSGLIFIEKIAQLISRIFLNFYTWLGRE